jgi:hypothetical protein
MKTKLPLLSILLILFSFNALSQQEKGIYGTENWLSIWADFMPAETVHREPTQILSGEIKKDTKLFKRETYLLSGNVFVKDSATLTIEPGTVILGDYKSKGSLIISRGSKIIAEGTQTDPIIFSSNSDIKKKGDWGGIFILGNAPVNKRGDSWELEYGLKPSSQDIIKYGGPDMESNSGILKYVRIEYAGNRSKKYGYYNSLMLAGVGNKTIIDNIMVSYSEGNSFYILGGNTNLNKIVSFRASKKDFIVHYGAQTSISNSIVIKSPYYTASGGGSSIYIASYEEIDEIDITKCVTHLEGLNLTLMVLSDDLEVAMDIGLVNEGLYVKAGATFSIKKSVFSGFNPAIVFDNNTVINNDNLEKMKISNMYFNNCKGNIFIEGISNNEDLEYWYGNAVFQNVYSKGSDRETFIDAHNLEDPDFRLRINKIIAINLPDED